MSFDKWSIDIESVRAQWINESKRIEYALLRVPLLWALGFGNNDYHVRPYACVMCLCIVDTNERSTFVCLLPFHTTEQSAAGIVRVLNGHQFSESKHIIFGKWDQTMMTIMTMTTVAMDGNGNALMHECVMCHRWMRCQDCEGTHSHT